MSEKEQNTIPSNEEESEENQVQKKRDELQNFVENENYESVINEAFKIIQDKDKRLISDALEAIRKVVGNEPKLLNSSQINTLIDFLSNSDDILRASTVLILKPLALARMNELFDILINLLTSNHSSNCKEETIRLLGYIGSQKPGKVRDKIPLIASFLKDDEKHVYNRALEVLKLLSKDEPRIVESAVKNVLKDIENEELSNNLNDLIARIIQKRETRQKVKNDEEENEKENIIPDVEEEEDKKDEKTDDERKPLKEMQTPTIESESELEADENKIKEEIGAKIEEEFSKIDDKAKNDELETKDLKEIKSEQDIIKKETPNLEIRGDESSKEIAKEQKQDHKKEVPSTIPPSSESDTREDLIRKQFELKEKELKRREDELKQMELEKKELELMAKELELERQELIKSKLEKLETEVKRKEQELKEKELSLKMKELEKKEKELEKAERKMEE